MSTAATIQSQETRADFEQLNRGDSQHDVEVSRMQVKIDFLEQSIASNGADPKRVQELESLKRSRDFQVQMHQSGLPESIKATTSAPQAAAEPLVNRQATELYETQFLRAVREEERRMKDRGMKVDSATAGQIVEARIKQQGLASVMPVYAKFLERNAQQAIDNEAVAKAAAAPKDNSSVVRAEIIKLNKMNRENEAAGRAPEAWIYNEVERLSRLL